MATTTRTAGLLGATVFLLLCAVLMVGITAFVVFFPMLALAVLGVNLAGARTA